jgi:DNA-binding protein
MLTVDKDEMMMQGKMKIVEKGKGTKIFVIEDVKETVLVGMTEAEMISIEDVLIMTEEIAGMNVDTEMIGTADVHLVIPGIGRRMNLEETGEQMIEMPERISQLVKSVTLQILTE